MGRPRIQIDRRGFENLCGLQCTLAEIACFFNCSEDTIERWCKRTYHTSFADVFKSKSSTGKISLRRYQFKLAERNASMAIWLGKQMLGQKDYVEVESSADDALIQFLGRLDDEAKDTERETE